MKVNVSKSLIFSKKLDDLKASLEYLNQEGYFSDNEDFAEYKECSLKSVLVDEDIIYPYEPRYYNHNFSYFMPKSKAVFEEEQAKYRPFQNMSELPFKVGDIIAIRLKNAHDTVYTMVTDIICNGDKIKYISFGTTLSKFSPIHYFINGYEYCRNGIDWLPFGIESEEYEEYEEYDEE